MIGKMTVSQIKEVHHTSPLNPLFWYGRQLGLFGDMHLNSDAKHISAMPSDLGGQVFFRSASPFKEPGGGVISAKKARRLGGDSYYASVKKVQTEVRVYMMPRKIVARYALPKSKRGRNIELIDGSCGMHKPFEGAGNMMFDLISRVMDSAHYSFNHQAAVDGYVIDLAIQDELLKVVELNPIQASGVYGEPI